MVLYVILREGTMSCSAALRRKKLADDVIHY